MKRTHRVLLVMLLCCVAPSSEAAPQRAPHRVLARSASLPSAYPTQKPVRHAFDAVGLSYPKGLGPSIAANELVRRLGTKQAIQRIAHETSRPDGSAHDISDHTIARVLPKALEATAAVLDKGARAKISGIVVFDSNKRGTRAHEGPFQYLVGDARPGSSVLVVYDPRRLGAEDGDIFVVHRDAATGARQRKRVWTPHAGFGAIIELPASPIDGQSLHFFTEQGGRGREYDNGLGPHVDYPMGSPEAWEQR